MIIPKPVHLVRSPGVFRPSAITASGDALPVAELLQSYVDLPLREDGDVVLEADGEGEAYTVSVTPDGVRLRGSVTGLRHAVQSVRQLMSGGELPLVEVRDEPRFAWRGAMIDVARHFLPVAYLRTLVDQIALYKLNVLHLHLTDDQGWRMPVDRHPALTAVGGHRTESMVGPAGGTTFDGIPHGGAYTKDELRSLVAHAAARGVTVVPEIEMPGHARAALAAHPELGNFPDRALPVWTGWGVSEALFGVQEQTFEFLRDVLTEVLEVFPSPYVHIGGDECPAVEWETSPLAALRIAEEGLSGPEALHGWFLGRISEFLVSRGRHPICWDDGENPRGLPLRAAVMIWRDPGHGLEAVRRGHDLVMAPFRSTYLDYPQSAEGEPPGQPAAVVSLEDVYRNDPLPAEWDEECAARVLGTQGQLWTEFVRTPEHAEYLAFPRLCALAESAWSADRDWDDFRARLEAQAPLLAEVAPHHRPLQVSRAEAGRRARRAASRASWRPRPAAR
ncbi:beta-N-acetylhexosaminidase [Lentzea sp. NPDC059081]|uniref:beta-N-acetylhexosaminidase n=1 Tax=Lentzea sp. NPDC059081 TaxID=3346719 RepID=UPI00369C58AA